MQGQYSGRITISLTPEQREGLDDVAYQKSEPGQQVPVSSVVREAIVQYLEEKE